jgi:hypothetical protein
MASAKSVCVRAHLMYVIVKNYHSFGKASVHISVVSI